MSEEEDCDSSKQSYLPVSIHKTLQNIKRYLNPYGLHTISTDNAQVTGVTVFVRNMLAGGVSASIAVTIMAPIERIKLILQIQNTLGSKPGRVPYAGLRDAFIRIPKEQGILSFWRGNGASILRGFPYQALNFALRDKYKDYFVRGYSKTDQFWTRVGGNLLVGGLSGASSMAVLYPLDYARTRMAMDFGCKKTREVKSIKSVIFQTYRQDGLRGLYRGFWFSLVGVFIYRSTYFGLFDTAKDASSSFGIEHLRHTFLFAFLTAELSSTMSGLVAYPFDTVRRFMMMESAKPKLERKYNGSMDCAKNIYAQRGIGGFYRGGFVNLIRGTGGALMLVLYDEIQHEFWKKDRERKKAEDDCLKRKELAAILKMKEIDVRVCVPTTSNHEFKEQVDRGSLEEMAERINIICDH